MSMRPSPRFEGNGLRAVVDTNVLVSGLIATTGAPGRIVAAAVTRQIDLVLTSHLADELVAVVARPYLARYEIDDRTLADLLELVLPSLPDVDVEIALRDPADRIVIEAALGGGAQVIVTGDRDLLDEAALVVWLAARGVEVVTPATFAARLASVG